jgi:cytolysin-activating lysine-acyltransferase
MFFKRSESKSSQQTPPAPIHNAMPPLVSGTPPPLATKKSAEQVQVGEAKAQPKTASSPSAAFGQMVGILMKSPQMRKMSLGELEWMIVPPIKHGNYMLAHVRSKEGAMEPIGFLVWAVVSPEVDKRLSDPSKPLRLAPQEWKSGDIPWVISGAGDEKALKGMIEQLRSSVFKDREVKMRVAEPQHADGDKTRKLAS